MKWFFAALPFIVLLCLRFYYRRYPRRIERIVDRNGNVISERELGRSMP